MAVKNRNVLDWGAFGDTDELENGVRKLSEAYANAGRAYEAIALIEEIHADTEETLGPDHPWTARARTWLADMYLFVGQWDEAIPRLEREVAELNSPFRRFQLGRAYVGAGRYQAAISLWESLLPEVERAVGVQDRNYKLLQRELEAARAAAEEDDGGPNVAERPEPSVRDDVFCTNCGASVKQVGQRYCGRCGKAL